MDGLTMRHVEISGSEFRVGLRVWGVIEGSYRVMQGYIPYGFEKILPQSRRITWKQTRNWHGNWDYRGV